MSQKVKKTLWVCVVMGQMAFCPAQASLWQRFWGGVEEKDQKTQGTLVVNTGQDPDLKSFMCGPDQRLDEDLTASSLNVACDFVVVSSDEKTENEQGHVAFYCTKETFSQIMQQATESMIAGEGTSLPYKTIRNKVPFVKALVFQTPCQYHHYLAFLKHVSGSRKLAAFESYDFPEETLHEMGGLLSGASFAVHEHLNQNYAKKIIFERYQMLLPFMNEENLTTLLFYPFTNGLFFGDNFLRLSQGGEERDFDHEGLGVLHHEALRVMGPDVVRSLSLVFKWMIVLRKAEQVVPQGTPSPIPEADVASQHKEEDYMLEHCPDGQPPQQVPGQQNHVLAPPRGLVMPYVIGFGAFVIGTLILSNHNK